MAKSVIVLAALVSIGGASCADQDEQRPPEKLSSVSQHVSSCSIQAYQTPTYVRPADDGVALEAQLEAAGAKKGSESNWIGAAAGNFCFDSKPELVLLRNQASNFSVFVPPTPSLQKESVGPTLAGQDWTAVAVGNLDPSPPAGAFEHVVAVRKITANNKDDLVVMSVDPTTCNFSTTPLKSKRYGSTTAGQEWVDVTVGNFDGGSQKEIVMVRNNATNFAFVKLNGTALPNSAVLLTLDSNASRPWKALAAGDIDGDGLDELIAARSVSNGVDKTVFVYKWNGTTFASIATSGYGNDGNGHSDWSKVAVGDFNGDGTKSIVLVKNNSPNFLVFKKPTGATDLQLLSTDSLDAVSSQRWKGLAAIDWIQGDQGAAELIAVRAPATPIQPGQGDPYRADVFVYGDDFNRAQRDSAVANMKAQGYFRLCTLAGDCSAKDGVQGRFGPLGAPGDRIKDIKEWLEKSHSNTYFFDLNDGNGNQVPSYNGLVEFLEATQDFCVDNQQLRVVAVLMPYPDQLHATTYGAYPTECSYPMNNTTRTTTWDETTFFPTVGSPCNGNKDQPNNCPGCRNYAAWGEVLGKLATQYPHLVGVGFEDFTHYINVGDYSGTADELSGGSLSISEQEISTMQANMRHWAPWMNFLPTVYRGWRGDALASKLPDWGSIPDKLIYYFRDEKAGVCPSGCVDGIACPGGPLEGEVTKLGGCLGGQCGELELANAPSEFCEIKSILPRNRKMMLGVYFTGHVDYGIPTAWASYSLARLALNHPWFGFDGVFAYFMGWDLKSNTLCSPHLYTNTPNLAYADQSNPNNIIYCPPGTDYLANDNKFCTITKLFSGEPDPDVVGDIDLTASLCLASPPLASQVPYGFVSTNGGTTYDNIVYRGKDDANAHLLWRSSTQIGDTDLGTLSGAPDVLSDPNGYAFPSLNGGTSNAVYLDPGNNVHVLWWTSPQGPVGDDNITSLANAPPATGTPMGFVATPFGNQVVLFKDILADLRDTWWTTGSVLQSNLSSRASAPQVGSAPFGYVDGTGSLVAVYRSAAGRLEDIWWNEQNAFRPAYHDDLTSLTGVFPATDPTAYVDSSNMQHIIFGGTDQRMHEIWIPAWGSLGQGQLTDGVSAPAPTWRPSAYFNPATGTNHVIYASSSPASYSHWELRWTCCGVTPRNLSALARVKQQSATQPSAYLRTTDGTNHVIYRTADFHLHDLEWGR